MDRRIASIRTKETLLKATITITANRAGAGATHASEPVMAGSSHNF